MATRGRMKGISNRVLCKLGTLSHNRQFSSRDFVDYTGEAPTQLRVLMKRGIVEQSREGLYAVRSYYPTRRGWDIIERACRIGYK